MSPLISVKDLEVSFSLRGGLLKKKSGGIRAVDKVSFEIPAGKTVGLVGESGSGKTTLGKALLRLTRWSGGEVFYDGKPLAGLSEKAFRPFRRDMQMVFQDPYSSLNPRMTIFEIVGEALEIHFPKLSREERREKIAALLVKVGLSADHLLRYPHEFSGGQRQRIGIARALAVNPRFVVLDESVSALDVSVQAAILNLLRELQDELKLTYLFISHDLGVVEHMSDEVLVMHKGKIVEAASAEKIFTQPEHAYTRELLASIPKW